MMGKGMFSSCAGRTERGGAGFSKALIISVTTIANLAYFYSKILVIMIMAERAEHAPKIEAPIPIALLILISAIFTILLFLFSG